MSGLGRGLGSLIPKKPNQPPNPAGMSSATMRALEVPQSQNQAKAEAQQQSQNEAQSRPMTKSGALEVDIDSIDPNPYQPRTVFDNHDLEELIESVKIHGVMQPLIVTKKGERFELIAGERRLRASKAAGLKQVPVVVREWVDDRMKLELALIENIQRADLNPIEEAIAYKHLIEEFNLTQDEVGTRVGKSRPTVANAMRLLQLPLEIQTALREKRIAAGQARAILALKTTNEQLSLFHKIVNIGMTTRQAEDAVVETRVTTTRRDPNIMAYENELRSALGAKVRITEKNGKGKIVIEYFSREDLMEMKKRLTRE
jgi:ParB family chromosome partitioning protein